MMILTAKANIRCNHLAPVKLDPAQTFVTIDGSPVLVKPDPEGRPVIACPFIGLGIKPCTRSLAVMVGYSDYIKIGEAAVCLDTLKGMTDSVPPVAFYSVHGGEPGQSWIDHK